MFWTKPAERPTVCVCIMSTRLFQAHLQFNEVLHQTKLALYKEFLLLQSNNCNGLQVGQNGGFQYMMHAAYRTNTHRAWTVRHYHSQLDESWCCSSQCYHQVAFKTNGNIFMMAREQHCRNMVTIWYHCVKEALGEALSAA